MTDVDWKARLAAMGEDLVSPGGVVKVLVDLGAHSPSEGCLRRLEGYGLAVAEVVSNKVLGKIPAERLEDLRADPEVAEVEVSVRLKSKA